MRMRIGVTGGIGSGKSEVCDKFRSLGVSVLSADHLAHQLTDSDPELKNKIVALLGPESYDSQSGLLAREHVARLVFNNPKNREALNSIVHPAVLNAIEREAHIVEQSGKESYLLVEAALMFESGLDDLLDYVLTVAADENRRLERIARRDKLRDEQIRQRMAAQFPIEDGIKASDFVINNNGSLDALDRQVQFFHHIFLSLKPRNKKRHGHS